jgi:Acetyltransferase (GNAT) domain
MENNNSNKVINMKNTKNGTIFTYKNGTQWLTRFNGTSVRLPKNQPPLNKPKSPNKQPNYINYRIGGPGTWLKNNPGRTKNVLNLARNKVGSGWLSTELAEIATNNRYKNYIVVTPNSKLLGYALTRNNKPNLELVFIGINKNARGLKIGKNLMSIIKSNAKGKYSKIVLNSIANRNTLAFYNKSGFKTPIAGSLRKQFSLRIPRKRPRANN